MAEKKAVFPVRLLRQTLKREAARFVFCFRPVRQERAEAAVCQDRYPERAGFCIRESGFIKIPF